MGRLPGREEADRYVETLLVTSRAEHLRQHERSTIADRAAEDRLQGRVTGHAQRPASRYFLPTRTHELAIMNNGSNRKGFV
jgi:hypothetical protein